MGSLLYQLTKHNIKKYQEKNKDKIQAQRRQYYKENREKLRQKDNEYRQKVYALKYIKQLFLDDEWYYGY
tara:strand:+ start:2376 stop:2585 length:210 start_codon:yes stop_codon:yes gene_type:complete